MESETVNRCGRCKLESSDPSLFVVANRDPSSKRFLCKRCQVDYGRQWRDSRAAALAELKSAPCTDCGETFPPMCMEFDHIDAGNKVSGVSTIAYRYKWERVLEEIAKCELVCANCHRIRTYIRTNARNDGYSV